MLLGHCTNYIMCDNCQMYLIVKVSGITEDITHGDPSVLAAGPASVDSAFGVCACCGQHDYLWHSVHAKNSVAGARPPASSLPSVLVHQCNCLWTLELPLTPKHLSVRFRRFVAMLSVKDQCPETASKVRLFGHPGTLLK